MLGESSFSSAQVRRAFRIPEKHARSASSWLALPVFLVAPGDAGGERKAEGLHCVTGITCDMGISRKLYGRLILQYP